MDFTPGQVWSYHTRPGEEESRLTICRIDNEPAGAIVHVYLDGVRLRNPGAPTGETTAVSHMPFALASVRDSVRELLASDAPLPDFEDGYRHWREAFDQGKGGFWTKSVAEVLTTLEEALRAAQPRQEPQPEPGAAAKREKKWK
jgi:hypothetical protein